MACFSGWSDAVAAGAFSLVFGCASPRPGEGGSSTASGGGGAGGKATSGDGGHAGAATGSAGSDVGGASAEGGAGEGGLGGAGVNLCGNGVIDDGEECDGDAIGDVTCETFGLGPGPLLCNGGCTVVLTECALPESCSNGTDEDGDGLVDCDDPDCAAKTICTDTCASALFVPVPSSTTADLTGLGDTLVASCVDAGRERVFQVVAPEDGVLLVEVQFPAFDAAVSVRTACDDASSEVACEDAQVQGLERALLPVTAGQSYFVVVESVSGEGGFYQLHVESLAPESSCDDFVDDDFDGYVDCDDADACQGSSLCTPGAGAVGSPCADNPDCASTGADPLCLQAFLGYANGACSEFCDLTNDDCPAGSHCVDLGISIDGACMAACSSSSDCRPGYACVDRGAAGRVCDKPPEVACNDGADNDSDGLVDCEDPDACSTSSPACEPGAGEAGSPCQLHSDCEADHRDPFCIDQFHFSWPGGYCSQFCDVASGDCPTGTACSTWISFTSGNGLCFATCGTSDDCPLGYACQSDGAHDICVH